MLLQATYHYPSPDRDAVHRRFLDTGGTPPDKVTMLGRWHYASGNGGFLVAETDDPEALASWLQEWTDLISFSVHPVLDDEGFANVISGEH